MQSFSSTESGGRKRAMIKTIAQGRGRKRSDWVNWLYPLLKDRYRRCDIMNRFDDLRKCGVKFDCSLLSQVAIDIIENSADEEFNKNTVASDGKLIITKIDYQWIYSFIVNLNIVWRKQCGKLNVSAEKEKEINLAVVFHLGQVGLTINADEKSF